MEEHFGLEPDEIEEKNVGGRTAGSRHLKKKLPKSQIEKSAIRKESRKKKQEKKSRLIIRNLSFKVGEEELKQKFAKFGDVVDINIPKKPDGKMRGFAFVQYRSFQSAIEAVRNLNYKKLQGRPIAVDYAVAKDKYQHITSAKHTTNIPSREPQEANERQLSEEKESEDEKSDSDSDEDNKGDSVEKNENESASDAENEHVKKFLKEFDANQESASDGEDEPEETQSVSDSSSESDNDSIDFRSQDVVEEEDDDDDDNDIGSLKHRKHPKVDGQESLNRKKTHSNDIGEGKTVFIRNLSFDTEQDALKRTMETFGPTKYCLLVIDRLTELAKGTAFVKFENKEDAEKAIQKMSDADAEGIFLDGRKLYCAPAVSREELKPREESEKKIGKDKRNLYLLKVGTIKNDSVEAEGVSSTDMAKRAKLEILKRNKLKNFKFFVSDKRLCIHNIPSYYSDAELRKLFKNAANPGAKVTEAKVMRNFKKVSTEGIAESKGFGFVAFEKHEDALKALKEINNNPSIFTQKQRPIVEFSVENSRALLMKHQRKEKSQMKLKKEFENLKADHPEEENLTSLKFKKKQNNKNNNTGVKKFHARNNSNLGFRQKTNKSKKNKVENKPYRERKPQFKLKEQHKNSDDRSIKEKPQKKKNKKQQKKNRASSGGIGSGDFTQMVNKYKQKLLSNM